MTSNVGSEAIAELAAKTSGIMLRLVETGSATDSADIHRTVFTGFLSVGSGQRS